MLSEFLQFRAYSGVMHTDNCSVFVIEFINYITELWVCYQVMWRMCFLVFRKEIMVSGGSQRYLE